MVAPPASRRMRSSSSENLMADGSFSCLLFPLCYLPLSLLSSCLSPLSLPLSLSLSSPSVCGVPVLPSSNPPHDVCRRQHPRARKGLHPSPQFASYSGYSLAHQASRSAAGGVATAPLSRFSRPIMDYPPTRWP